MDGSVLRHPHFLSFPVFYLGKRGKCIFGNVLQVVLENGLAGLFSIVGTEDEDSLAVQQERVHIGDADAGLREGLNSIGSTTGLVVELDSEDVAQGNGHAGLLQLLKSAQRFAADEAVDAILCRIGNGGSNNLECS